MSVEIEWAETVIRSKDERILALEQQLAAANAEIERLHGQLRITRNAKTVALDELAVARCQRCAGDPRVPHTCSGGFR